MVFSSPIFLSLFLPALLFTYFVLSEKYRNSILLLSSMLFYSWGEPKYIFFMIISIIVNYLIGLVIGGNNRHRFHFVVFALIYNFGVLFLFKYLNFSIYIINYIARISIHNSKMHLPIGISFFTFQIVSYIIDVYRKDVKAQNNIYNLALYISLFPQLIAGPIVRYHDVEKQIYKRNCNWDKAYEGVLRFSLGFSKKVLIADQLSILVDSIFSGSYPSLISNWIGIVAYSLQIYFDFSGYSDMAIGLGKIFGFDFLENFDYPYIAKSITEFWRRWHISLSSWFRDYLYIPLGGNRVGTLRSYFNLIIVFFITGLWHGASFQFIAWGLYYVIFLIIERAGFGLLLKKTPTPFQHIYSITVIMIGWVLFRADGLRNALYFIEGMFFPYGNDLIHFQVSMNPQYWFCLIVGIYFSTFHNIVSKKICNSKIGLYFRDTTILFLFFIAISYTVGSGFSPFLYFRF